MPGNLVFYTTSDGASTTTEKLRITSEGLVGIGLVNPTYKLHVYGGNVRFTQPAGTDATFDINEGTTTNPLRFTQTATEARIQNIASLPFNIRSQAGSGSTAHLAFWTRDDERLRITSDGRVLVNIASSRNVGSANARMLQVESSGGGSGISIVRNSNNASGSTLDLGKSRGYPHTIVQDGDRLGQINFGGADGTDLQSQGAQIFAQVDGTPGENDMPGRLIFSTTADGAASPTERVRIASDGDITISPAGDPIVTITGSGHPQVNLTSTSGTDHCSVNFGDSDDNNAGMIQYTNSTNIMQFHTDGSERARLIDTGRFLVGTQTSSQNGADGYIQSVVAGTSLGAWGSHAGSTGTRRHMRFSNPNGVIGYIHTSGSGTSFGTSSDYRLKENQSAISNAISKINQLKPYTFNFKANPSEKIDGFFAHEVQELIPYVVDGEKDGEEMQGIDYGKLTPLLTAALQEAVAKIEVLESKVASLGG